MTTKAEWMALAERCEMATGPDREIDWAIHGCFGMNTGYFTPRYTASIDAITALIERELPGAFLVLIGKDNSHVGGVRTSTLEGLSGNCATEPLARCAAFAKAMAERASG